MNQKENGELKEIVITRDEKGRFVKGTTQSKEWKKIISDGVKNNLPSTIFKKGCIPWSKNKTLSKKHIEKLSKAKKGKTHEEIFGEEGAKKRKKIMKRFMKEWWKKVRGTKKEKEMSEKVSKALKKENTITFNYSPEFKKLRKEMWKRDNFTCQLCGDTILEKRNLKAPNFLTTHHIDYDKDNNDPNNLITLCNFCNISVNNSREQWTKFFQNKMGVLQ